MIAIKKAGLAWRVIDSAADLASDEEVLTVPFIYAADGMTPLMVRDAVSGAVRAMTTAEVAALPAAKASAAAAAAKTAATNTIQNGDALAADATMRAIIGVVLAIRDEFSNLRQAIPHRIISITRSGTVATATTDGAHGLAVGGPIAIAGADVAAYNLTTTIASVPTSTTFTYTVAGTPTTPAAGSLWYTRGAVPQLLDITDAQLRAAINAKISATAQ